MISHGAKRDPESRQDLFHEAMVELNRSWLALNSMPDTEYWDVANTHVSAALAAAQAVVREEKRQWGLPLNSATFRVPWLAIRSKTHPRLLHLWADSSRSLPRLKPASSAAPGPAR